MCDEFDSILEKLLIKSNQLIESQNEVMDKMDNGYYKFTKNHKNNHQNMDLAIQFYVNFNKHISNVALMRNSIYNKRQKIWYIIFSDKLIKSAEHLINECKRLQDEYNDWSKCDDEDD